MKKRLNLKESIYKKLHLRFAIAALAFLLWTIFFVGGIVVLFMWALEIGPFEKSYPPSPTYYAPVNSGYNPSFGGSEPSKYSNRETCGSHHCSCKVTTVH